MSARYATTTQLQVTCVTIQYPGTSSAHISHIGTSGTMWTKAEAIAAIDSGQVGFYTTVGGHTARVHVVRPWAGQPYLHTHPDGYGANNLLALNRCS